MILARSLLAGSQLAIYFLAVELRKNSYNLYTAREHSQVHLISFGRIEYSSITHFQQQR